jgi:hypothetical protein
MPLEHITDHAERAIARLPTQFRKPRIESLVRALCRPMQEVEDMFWDLLTKRGLNTAVGVHLDNLGRIVGQLRGGLSDDSYRTRIRVRIALNKGSGTPNDLLKIFRLLVPAPQAVTLLEQFPAAFVMRVGDVLPVVAADLAAILQSAKVAGVRAVLEYSLASDSDSFTFDGTGPGKGWGTVSDPSIGGRLASAVEKP